MSPSISLPTLADIPPVPEILLALLFGLLAAYPLQVLASRYDTAAPLIPLGIAAAFIAIVSYGLGGGGVAGMVMLLIGLILLIASWIDLAVLRLPNPFVIGLGLLAIVRIGAQIGPDIASALAGGVIGLLLMGLTGAAYKLVRRKSGLGMGDVKITAALGMLVGAQGILFVLLVASVLQALIGLATLLFGSGKIRQEQPFGPALALAAWLLLLLQA